MLRVPLVCVVKAGLAHITLCPHSLFLVYCAYPMGIALIVQIQRRSAASLSHTVTDSSLLQDFSLSKPNTRTMFYGPCMENLGCLKALLNCLHLQ